MNHVPIVVATDLEVHFSVLKKGCQYFWQYSVCQKFIIIFLKEMYTHNLRCTISLTEATEYVQRSCLHNNKSRVVNVIHITATYNNNIINSNFINK